MWAMQMGIVGAAVMGAPVPQDDTSVTPPRPPFVLNPLVNTYRTADGRWLSLCMLQLDVYWRGVLEVVGRADLIEDPRFADGALASHFDDLVEELEKAFAARTLAEWRVELVRQPGQWDVVQHIVELPDDPQARANGFVQTVAYPSGHELPLIASPVQFDRTPSTLGRAPEFGADTDELLRGLGFDDDAIIDAKVSGGVV
jgi:crotonobetainyl-CoA:carnitine CoA-transferase CaiB-like acyl-CoA transferase